MKPGKNSFTMNNSKQKIVYLGTSDFASTILAQLISADYNIVAVITKPDSKSGRGNKISESPVKYLAGKYGIPVYQPTTKIELTDTMNYVKPELGIVAAYGMIIPTEALEVPRLGFINVHGSILPKYRGAAPVSAAILAGDKQTGITIMKLAERMDTGDIIKISKLNISEKDNTVSLMARLATLGADTLIDILPNYINNKIISSKQNDQEATYCKMIHKEDGFLLPEESADEILRKIRAYYPWPGITFIDNNKKYKVISAVKSDIKLHPLELAFIDGKILLGTTTEALEIITIQPEGKKAMSGKDYINGIKKGA